MWRCAARPATCPGSCARSAGPGAAATSRCPTRSLRPSRWTGAAKRSTGWACNAFWGENGECVGDNTDVPGVLAALDDLEAPPGGWLLVGTGGGARAAVGAARDRGAPVAVVSRSADRGRRFLEWAAAHGVAAAEPGGCTTVINTTPLGLAPKDPLPLATPPSAAAVALDMVYGRDETAWTRAMRAAGLRAADGRTMLVAQGAAALERWFPGVRAPVEVMRAAVDARLR